jgi:hypothetical protein
MSVLAHIIRWARVGRWRGGLLDVTAGDANPALAVGAIQMPECGAAGVAFESHGHDAILA